MVVAPVLNLLSTQPQSPSARSAGEKMRLVRARAPSTVGRAVAAQSHAVVAVGHAVVAVGRAVAVTWRPLSVGDGGSRAAQGLTPGPAPVVIVWSASSPRPRVHDNSPTPSPRLRSRTRRRGRRGGHREVRRRTRTPGRRPRVRRRVVFGGPLHHGPPAGERQPTNTCRAARAGCETGPRLRRDSVGDGGRWGTGAMGSGLPYCNSLR